MSVRSTLDRALSRWEQQSESNVVEGELVQEARAWLARTEVLLEWIAKHPKMVEVNREAAALLIRYRGETA
jgi:hypothetical protein